MKRDVDRGQWSTPAPWLTRPVGFFCGLLCAVAVTVVLIEALRHDSQHAASPRTQMALPVAERAGAPFPRTIPDASGALLVIPHKPQRIVSQTLGTDELLLTIGDPQRIVALSDLVDDPVYSNVTAQAQQIRGRTQAGAEQILRFQPDMIFVATYSRAELLTLLEAAHAPVFRFGHFDALADIKLNIRTLGYIIGEDDRAETLVQHMERDLARVREHIPRGVPPLRVMSYGLDGYTGGAHTTFDDMVQEVGAVNIAALHGITGFRKISSEQLLQWNPEVIITSAARHALDDTRRQLLYDPAVATTTAGKRQRIIVIPHHIFVTVTHHVAEGIAQLARELYSQE